MILFYNLPESKHLFQVELYYNFCLNTSGDEKLTISQNILL